MNAIAHPEEDHLESQEADLGYRDDQEEVLEARADPAAREGRQGRGLERIQAIQGFAWAGRPR